jgi:hypothetical protein
MLMTKRSIAMLSVLALSLATFGVWQAGKSISVQALESSNASTSRQQTASSDPRPVTWEYKILSGDPTYVGRPASPPVRSALVQINLEDEINKLAVQGYVVESFQAYTALGGGPDGNSSFRLASAGMAVVLLKRQRK